MKRLFLMLCIAAGLAACGDGYNEGTDSDTTNLNSPTDTYRSDTAVSQDTNRTDTNRSDTMR
jgi:hypothetical protein